MTLRLVVGPTTLPISVAQAKANGRIEGSAEDGIIEGFIRSALAHAERYCSTAFEPQTWELALGAFPVADIDLGQSIVSVTSIKYDPPEGAEATVATEDYVVDPVAGSIVPVGAWPATKAGANTVRVRFVIGSGTPHDVRQAIYLLTQHYYENREAVVTGTATKIPLGVEALLGLHRRQFV